MKRAALILCILGFASLVVGSVLSIPSVRSIMLPTKTIPCSGTIRQLDESSSQTAEAPLAQPTSDQKLYVDPVRFLPILASIGFFTAGLVINRKKD